MDGWWGQNKKDQPSCTHETGTGIVVRKAILPPSKRFGQMHLINLCAQNKKTAIQRKKAHQEDITPELVRNYQETMAVTLRGRLVQMNLPQRSKMEKNEIIPSAEIWSDEAGLKMMPLKGCCNVLKPMSDSPSGHTHAHTQLYVYGKPDHWYERRAM
ncbi:hypothetical protein T265_04629 [Opisthorchis viverrini]|uniref:Uncharacterized protein n=1 Tax=Opisthorchis viverrini TaxID=6198 RepID=A0A074ZZ46_OPIVI|nr:hypothetical protein T265_04629 [Opisthorchis viverrini]KER28585.1 hypothetical protein T265_04629 [Opisthorchis viverrini]